MNRTTRYKFGYVAAFIGLGALSIAVILKLGGGAVAALVVAALLLIPGRVQGLFYRQLFRARRLLDTGHPAEAIPHLEGFLASVRARPWRKRLMWLSWSLYTPSAEAMAVNNLAVAQLELDRASEAEAAFLEALALDPLYPIPHFNLAKVYEMRADRAAAVQAVADAKRLGYAQSTVDAVIQSAQSLLARFEGRGNTME